MNQNKYALNQEQAENKVPLVRTPELPINVKRFPLKDFPEGDLFTRLHPEYKSFQDIRLN